MATYYSLLPQNEKQCREFLSKDAKISEMRSTCENVEIRVANDKLNNEQINCFHIQMLIYLVTDKLPFAKYLHNRVPKQVKELDSWKAIWEVGKAQWKGENSMVYKLVATGKWDALYKPFMEKLEANYRLKQAEIVSKSYTSISIKELMAQYLGFTKLEELNQFMAMNGLSDIWTFDDAQSPQIVNISQKKQNYEEMLDAPSLLNQLTKYVCFMEAENTVGGDDGPTSISSK